MPAKHEELGLAIRGSTNVAGTDGQVLLHQRIGQCLEKVATLPEKLCSTVKNMADPLFLFYLTNQHSSSGEIIGNGLVLALLEQERSGDERNVVKPRFCGHTIFSSHFSR